MRRRASESRSRERVDSAGYEARAGNIKSRSGRGAVDPRNDSRYDHSRAVERKQKGVCIGRDCETVKVELV